jgi:hypothetical protein
MKAKTSLISVGFGFAAVLVVLTCPTLATAQLGDLPLVESAPTVQPGVPTSADAAVPTRAASSLYRVHLAVDGHVPGSVKILGKAGVLTPVRATVSVFQNGLLLTTTHSNERGHFQLPGLRPGTYSVIADAGRYMGVFTVEVLPYKKEKAAVTPVSLTAAEGEETPDGEMTLDLVLANEVDDETEDELPIVDGYPMMSGGGGGGGGGGALAGLLGLVGLAGLGGIGGGGGASPATP